MSEIQFYIKYILRTEKGGYNNWYFYFPLLGVACGIIAVIISFAIMQGMENEVFKKLETINFPSKILDKNFIKPDDEMFLFRIDKKAIVNNGGDYRVVNIRSIEHFHHFRNNALSEFIIMAINDSNGVLLGKGIALRLGVSVGDFIEIVSPTDVNLFTGIPTSKRIKVSGIFSLELFNYDDQYILTDLSIGEALFKDVDKQIYSYLSPSKIKMEYPNIHNIISWKDDYVDFISAMNLEKLAFSSFGFLIILLSAFSSFSIMCVTVIRRVSEIGILRTVGFTKIMITKIYFIHSFLIGLIGGLVGVIVSKIIIKLDNSLHIITRFFSTELIFNFKLNILNFEIFIIYIIGLIIMLLAGIYPSIYASNITILKSINFKK